MDKRVHVDSVRMIAEEIIAMVSHITDRLDQLEMAVYGDGVIDPLTPREIKEIGYVWYNEYTRKVKWKGTEVPQLSMTEWEIFVYLVRYPGFVRSRDAIITKVDTLHEVLDRTVDSHVKRMRRKFESVDPDFANIETLYGVGYRWLDTGRETWING